MGSSCSLRKRRKSSNSQMKEELSQMSEAQDHTPQTEPTTELSDTSPSVTTATNSPVLDEIRNRSKSAPDIPRPRVKMTPPGIISNMTSSLEGIPEDSAGYVRDSVISNPSVAGSTESSLSYSTPPQERRSTLHPSSHHPLSVKMERVKFDSISVSSRDGPFPADHDRFQTLLSKMEEYEHERQNQHNKTTEMMSELNQTLVSKMEGLTDKLDKLVTYFLSKHDDEDDKDAATGSTSNTTNPQEDMYRSSNFVEANLPQDSAVSSTVVLELAKVVPKWKFLARRLGIQEHEIQQITENYPSDVEEQSYQMLLKWKKSKSDTSCHTLGGAVRKEFGEELYFDFVRMVTEAGSSACSQ